MGLTHLRACERYDRKAAMIRVVEDAREHPMVPSQVLDEDREGKLKHWGRPAFPESQG